MTILESARLILRPPLAADVPAIAAWLGDYEVARNMSRVPHPYGEADAENFVAGMGIWAETENRRFTIARKEDGVFLGGCGLRARENGFEFGYWLGKPFWGAGYATEAAHRLVTFAFETLALESVHAGWFADNPASGHVLAKLGARHNGSSLRYCAARDARVLCHDMLLTRADFLRKQAA
jgi:RimJ/RimL family protein N-acetyltransferase